MIRLQTYGKLGHSELLSIARLCGSKYTVVYYLVSAENSADLHQSQEPIQPKVGGPDLADLALATPLHTKLLAINNSKLAAATLMELQEKINPSQLLRHAARLQLPFAD